MNDDLIQRLKDWGRVWPLSKEAALRLETLEEFHDDVWNDALDAAIKIVRDYEPYSPYIVGKMKIKERKDSLINSIKELKK